MKHWWIMLWPDEEGRLRGSLHPRGHVGEGAAAELPEALCVMHAAERAANLRLTEATAGSAGATSR